MTPLRPTNFRLNSELLEALQRIREQGRDFRDANRFGGQFGRGSLIEIPRQPPEKFKEFKKVKLTEIQDARR